MTDVVEPVSSNPSVTSLSVGILPVLALSSVVALAITWVSLLVYDRYLAPRPKPFATVSLSQVLEAKQAQFADAVSRDGATEADRQRAIDAVDSLAPQLSKAVSELGRTCNCILLVREAVVGSTELDLTPQLLQMVGASDGDVAALRARLRASSSVEERK